MHAKASRLALALAWPGTCRNTWYVTVIWSLSVSCVMHCSLPAQSSPAGAVAGTSVQARPGSSAATGQVGVDIVFHGLGAEPEPRRSEICFGWAVILDILSVVKVQSSVKRLRSSFWGKLVVIRFCIWLWRERSNVFFLSLTKTVCKLSLSTK